MREQMYIRRIIILFVLAFIHSASPFSFAQDMKHPDSYKKAMNDIVDKNNKYTATIIKNACKGDKNFQFILAKAYLEGKNIEVDLGKGKLWLKRAADNGHSEAQIMYGTFSVEASKYKEAFAYFNQALVKYPKAANYQLGLLYFNGQGMVADKVKCLELMQEASKQGSGEADLFLYKCYFLGVGAKKDHVKALKHLEKSASKKQLEAVKVIVKHYCGENGADIDGVKLAKYLKMAKEVWPKPKKAVVSDDEDFLFMQAVKVKKDDGYELWRKEALKAYAPRAFQPKGDIAVIIKGNDDLERVAGQISNYDISAPSSGDCNTCIALCKKLEAEDYPAELVLAIEGGRYLLEDDYSKLSKGLRRWGKQWVTYDQYQERRVSAANKKKRAADEALAQKKAIVTYVMVDVPCTRCRGQGSLEGFKGSTRRCVVCKGTGKKKAKVRSDSSAARNAGSRTSQPSAYQNSIRRPSIGPLLDKNNKSSRKMGKDIKSSF
jgi:TPR repeat protein